MQGRSSSVHSLVWNGDYLRAKHPENSGPWEPFCCFVNGGFMLGETSREDPRLLTHLLLYWMLTSWSVVLLRVRVATVLTSPPEA